MPLRRAAGPCMLTVDALLLQNGAQGSHGTVTSKFPALVVIYRARAKRGPGRASVNPILCHYPTMASPDPLLLLPTPTPASLLWLTLGETEGIKD